MDAKTEQELLKLLIDLVKQFKEMNQKIDNIEAALNKPKATRKKKAKEEVELREQQPAPQPEPRSEQPAAGEDAATVGTVDQPVEQPVAQAVEETAEAVARVKPLSDRAQWDADMAAATEEAMKNPETKAWHDRHNAMHKFAEAIGKKMGLDFPVPIDETADGVLIINFQTASADVVANILAADDNDETIEAICKKYNYNEAMVTGVLILNKRLA